MEVEVAGSAVSVRVRVCMVATRATDNAPANDDAVLRRAGSGASSISPCCCAGRAWEPRGCGSSTRAARRVTTDNCGSSGDALVTHRVSARGAA